MEDRTGSGEDARLIPAVGQPAKQLAQTLGSGLGDTHLPSLPALRDLGAFLEEQIDEIRFPPPGRKLERVGAELVLGIDVGAGFDEDAAQRRLSPFARAEDEGRSLIIVPGFDGRSPFEEGGRRLPPVVHDGDMERRFGLRVHGFDFGALVDEEPDEIGVPAESGVVEGRAPISVPGVDELRGLFDHGLDGRNIPLSKDVKDLLGPNRARRQQNDRNETEVSFHGRLLCRYPSNETANSEPS